MPEQSYTAREIRFSEQERQFFREEVELLLEKGVLRKMQSTEGQFVSNVHVFLRPKKDLGNAE